MATVFGIKRKYSQLVGLHCHRLSGTRMPG
jgi:hypothetical protein